MAILETHFENRRFLIEEDMTEIGTYLRIFEDDRDTHDYLQDSVEDCKEFAEEEFGVPTDSWTILRV